MKNGSAVSQTLIFPSEYKQYSVLTEYELSPSDARLSQGHAASVFEHGREKAIQSHKNNWTPPPFINVNDSCFLTVS